MLNHQQEDDMPRPKQYLKPEELKRLRTIQGEIKRLTKEAYRIVRPTVEGPGAEAYWVAHILSALDEEEYPAGSADTMQDAIDALDRDHKEDD
jgi:hypothetical protein